VVIFPLPKGKIRLEHVIVSRTPHRCPGSGAVVGDLDDLEEFVVIA